MKEFICLGIESTSHTFGVGIATSSGKILANERDAYRPKLGSGIVPVEAAEHHKQVKEKVLQNVFEKSQLEWADIDIVAYSAGPGLPPSLNVGADFAEMLSRLNSKQLVKVNHAMAHLEIGKLTTNTKDPIFVYLSGGNTQVIAFTEGRYRIFGETMDIPVGNAFDVVARRMGLEMPGGVEIEKLARVGKYIELPYVVKGMDLSFSGIVTACERKINEGIKKEDIAYSLQETCFDMLAEVSERAMAHTEKKDLLLVGGVASNKRLQEIFDRMCQDRGAKMHVVTEEYSGDQAAMIAWTGILAKDSKQIQDKINPSWRVDQVDVTWI
jgi:universal protein Kae1